MTWHLPDDPGFISGPPEASAAPPTVIARTEQVWRRIRERTRSCSGASAMRRLGLSLLQVIDLVGHSFDWPVLVSRIAIVLLVFSFPIVATISWYHGDKGS